MQIYIRVFLLLFVTFWQLILITNKCKIIEIIKILFFPMLKCGDRHTVNIDKCITAF
jgi:hypothetical protein